MDPGFKASATGGTVGTRVGAAAGGAIPSSRWVGDAIARATVGVGVETGNGGAACEACGRGDSPPLPSPSRRRRLRDEFKSRHFFRHCDSDLCLVRVSAGQTLYVLLSWRYPQFIRNCHPRNFPAVHGGCFALLAAINLEWPCSAIYQTSGCTHASHSVSSFDQGP